MREMAAVAGEVFSDAWPAVADEMAVAGGAARRKHGRGAAGMEQDS